MNRRRFSPTSVQRGRVTAVPSLSRGGSASPSSGATSRNCRPKSGHDPRQQSGHRTRAERPRPKVCAVDHPEAAEAALTRGTMSACRGCGCAGNHSDQSAHISSGSTCSTSAAVESLKLRSAVDGARGGVHETARSDDRRPAMSDISSRPSVIGCAHSAIEGRAAPSQLQAPPLIMLSRGSYAALFTGSRRL